MKRDRSPSPSRSSPPFLSIAPPTVDVTDEVSKSDPFPWEDLLPELQDRIRRVDATELSECMLAVTSKGELAAHAKFNAFIPGQPLNMHNGARLAGLAAFDGCAHLMHWIMATMLPGAANQIHYQIRRHNTGDYEYKSNILVTHAIFGGQSPEFIKTHCFPYGVSPEVYRFIAIRAAEADNAAVYHWIRSALDTPESNNMTMARFQNAVVEGVLRSDSPQINIQPPILDEMLPLMVVRPKNTASTPLENYLLNYVFVLHNVGYAKQVFAACCDMVERNHDPATARAVIGEFFSRYATYAPPKEVHEPGTLPHPNEQVFAILVETALARSDLSLKDLVPILMEHGTHESDKELQWLVEHKGVHITLNMMKTAYFYEQVRFLHWLGNANVPRDLIVQCVREDDNHLPGLSSLAYLAKHTNLDFDVHLIVLAFGEDNENYLSLLLDPATRYCYPTLPSTALDNIIVHSKCAQWLLQNELHARHLEQIIMPSTQRGHLLFTAAVDI